jgi:MoaA/NifB/PqqE/SkfB family radical SAM enzyme
VSSAPTRARYPLPERVGAYGDRGQFERSRKESGQWVFWADRVDLVLAGRYDEVKPLHVELSPTYLCNFACPWCSCRSAREDWAQEDVFHHPRASELTVMRDAKLDRIIDNLARHGVGIMWVGGEPTMNRLLYPAVEKAHRSGLTQCIFTNGSLLDADRARVLFDAQLVFVRVSLNAVTPEVHQRHHDYDARKPYSDRVRDNLLHLARLRHEGRSPTMLGVSVVVDERNIGDLLPIARFLADICDRVGRGCIDYAIFRPAYPFYEADVQLRSDTVSRFIHTMEAGSPVYEALQSSGIDIVVPGDSLTSPLDEVDDDLGDACLACGWFGEITPNGDVVLCSDRYGNPEYFIGNAAASDLDELWSSERRHTVLDMVERTSCFKLRCPRNGRGFRFNKVFHQIEGFRRRGRLREVEHWIEDLRATLPPPTHSFFL